MEWTSIQEFTQNPIVFDLIVKITVILTVAFTSSSSTLRHAILPILVVGAYPAVLYCSNVVHRNTWAGFVCGDIVFGLLHYVEVALISKWSFEAQGPSSGAKLLETPRKIQRDESQVRSKSLSWSQVWERLKFGYMVKTSSRNEGTPWVVKNIPPFSTKDARFVPSRRYFYWHKLAKIGFTFLFVDLLSQKSKPLEENAQLYSAKKVQIFTGDRNNLTMEQILIRLITVILYWISTAFVIDAVSDIFAVLSVALHIKGVEHYPPLFGPVREAYTIRRFWG